MGAFDNYVCDGQMSIFDCFPGMVGEKFPTNLEEVREYIERRFCVKLVRMKDWEGYEMRKARWNMQVSYDHYRGVRDNKPFVGIDCNYGTSGFGRPCDTLEDIDDAVKMALDIRDGKR